MSIDEQFIKRPKITELKVKRFRTVHEKDNAGNRKRKRVEFMANRPVETVTGGKRFVHFFVDWIIIQVIWYCVEYVYTVFTTTDQMVEAVSDFGAFTIAVISLLFYPLYYIFFEHVWQRTPGKFLTKSLVIDEEGNKPEFKTNILRNIIRLVPFEIFSCLSERGWHDRWSDTYVVTQAEFNQIMELMDEQRQ